MRSAVIDEAGQLSSSMSSSFTSPKSSDGGGEYEPAQRSPAFSFTDAPPGGPGGDGNGRPGTATAAARARAAAAAGGAGINNANVNVRSRPGAGAAEKPLSTTNMTPKRPVREPLQQHHFDATAMDEATGASGSSSAQKLTRSDTAPLGTHSTPSPTKMSGQRSQVQAGLWAEQLAHRCFMCPLCVKVVNDPVLLVGDRKMVCRRCVPLPRPSGGVAELPPNLLEAIKEIYAVGDVKPLTPSAPQHAHAHAHAAAADDGKPPAHHESNGAAAAAADAEEKPAAASSGGTDKAANTFKTRVPRGSGRATGPTSRTYKVEADQKYEAAEYTAALELYTKAIQTQPLDGLTQLRFLYGNRSAAHFMAQRYEECVSDCLEVVKLEPSNVKMISRAARAAATMGDLKRAISILEATPAKSMSDAMSTDLAKYKTGLDLYNKAESGFGTADGDERYRMLVAQFSETMAFRIRYAESLMKQRQFARAAEILEVPSPSSRPPKVCLLLAQCLYQSGFERFDAARKALRDAAQLDDECAKLLKLIEIVDEGKQKGNANFTEKKFAAAVDFYTGAITSAKDNDQILRILYCNRAAANKELGRYREGVEDCTKAISLDKDFYKAYARRARCHQNLGDHFAAVQDFRRAVEFDRSDKELAKELRLAEYNLQKEAEREKDYYYQLGLTSTATEKEIKMKYRELSLRWHPDKCVSLDPAEKERAEHKFKVIGEAYATLSDPGKRREYDLKSSRSAFGGRAGGFGGFASTYSSYNNTSENFRGRTRGAPGGFW